ncbi:Secreted effector protein PipB2 [Anaerolineales bacterium]|nr:Secreted effector protein PipB2 [Anaerolineales bacterium]
MNTISSELQGVIIGGLFGFIGALLGTLISIWAENRKLKRENLQAVRLRLVGDHVQTSEILDFIHSQRKRMWPKFWIKTRADLSSAQLEYVDFRYQNLQNVIFSKANLHGGNFYKANLSGSDFAEADISDASLFEAVMRKTYFFKANITRSHIDRADLSQAGLVGCNLENASLITTKLCEADLRFSNFQGANLTGADLRGANIGSVNFRNATLDDAKLDKTIYDQKTVWPDGFNLDGSGVEFVEKASSKQAMAAVGRKVTNSIGEIGTR